MLMLTRTAKCCRLVLHTVSHWQPQEWPRQISSQETGSTAQVFWGRKPRKFDGGTFYSRHSAKQFLHISHTHSANALFQNVPETATWTAGNRSLPKLAEMQTVPGATKELSFFTVHVKNSAMNAAVFSCAHATDKLHELIPASLPQLQHFFFLFGFHVPITPGTTLLQCIKSSYAVPVVNLYHLFFHATPRFPRGRNLSLLSTLLPKHTHSLHNTLCWYPQEYNSETTAQSPFQTLPVNMPNWHPLKMVWSD